MIKVIATINNRDLAISIKREDIMSFETDQQLINYIARIYKTNNVELVGICEF